MVKRKTRRVAEENAEASRIMLGLLGAIEHSGARSQRHMAAELGIALGLVNAYIRRCVKKGLVKMGEAPARRYAYYLTPQGLAEKSRLTVEYLSYSFSFFREAKTDCSAVFQTAKLRGFNKMLLVGQSDLAEIARLCAMEHHIEIVELVQGGATQKQFMGAPIFKSMDSVSMPFDAALVTDLVDTRETTELAVRLFGADRVLVPELSLMRPSARADMAE